MTTQCSTMHCRGRAEIHNIPQDGKFWKAIANPAPFCRDCLKRAGKD